MKLSLFFLVTVLLISCKKRENPFDMQRNVDSVNFYQQVDTAITDFRYSPWEITMEAQNKGDSLQKNNPKNYARNILKKLIYCNCLDKSLVLDSFYKSNDVSSGFLQTEYSDYPNDVVDSVRKITTPMVIKFNLYRNDFNSKNYSLFCLELYESAFLDSLVKSYDSKILTGKEDY